MPKSVGQCDCCLSQVRWFQLRDCESLEFVDLWIGATRISTREDVDPDTGDPITVADGDFFFALDVDDSNECYIILDGDPWSETHGTLATTVDADFQDCADCAREGCLQLGIRQCCYSRDTIARLTWSTSGTSHPFDEVSPAGSADLPLVYFPPPSITGWIWLSQIGNVEHAVQWAAGGLSLGVVKTVGGVTTGKIYKLGGFATVGGGTNPSCCRAETTSQPVYWNGSNDVGDGGTLTMSVEFIGNKCCTNVGSGGCHRRCAYEGCDETQPLNVCPDPLPPRDNCDEDI